MRIVKAITVLVSMVLLYVLFVGCAGMYGGMYREEAVMEKPAPKAVEEAEVAVEERPMVSEREGAAPSDVEYAYVPVMPEDRKRVYSGFCQLRVESVEKTKNRIFSIAEQNGGYVESSFEDTVIIRVLAERFSEVFSTILGLGEVIDKNEVVAGEGKNEFVGVE